MITGTSNREVMRNALINAGMVSDKGKILNETVENRTPYYPKPLGPLSLPLHLNLVLHLPSPTMMAKLEKG
ncbi:MAG: hypothetical protein WCF06_00940 [Nitrososphaeraceae archaeon]